MPPVNPDLWREQRKVQRKRQSVSSAFCLNAACENSQSSHKLPQMWSTYSQTVRNQGQNIFTYSRRKISNMVDRNLCDAWGSSKKTLLHIWQDCYMLICVKPWAAAQGQVELVSGTFYSSFFFLTKQYTNKRRTAIKPAWLNWYDIFAATPTLMALIRA